MAASAKAFQLSKGRVGRLLPVVLPEIGHSIHRFARGWRGRPRRPDAVREGCGGRAGLGIRRRGDALNTIW
jgi:hypothetical protein